MRVFLVEADSGTLTDRQDQWVFRRAVVVSIEEDSAVHCVERGLHGEEVFAGSTDTGRFARPQDQAFFNPDTALVTEIGVETLKAGEPVRLSRILAWELCPPVDDPELAS